MSYYLYILGTILFTVYGQIILKLRVTKYGPLPPGIYDKFIFLLMLLLDPFIFSGLLAAFLAALCWMAVMTKFELSYAYPFTTFSFVLVIILSVFIFRDTITSFKVLGLALITIGIFLVGINK